MSRFSTSRVRSAALLLTLLSGLLAAIPALALGPYIVVDVGTLGGTISNASSGTAINNAGQIVGSSYLADNTTQHAFLWSNGVMTDLGTLGGVSSVAADINDNGQVVGSSTLASGDSHAFSWINGVMTDLGTLGGLTSVAYGVNSTGVVLGKSDTTSGTSPFIFKNGLMSAFFSGSSVVAINDLGQALGTTGDLASGTSYSFLWDPATYTTTNIVKNSPDFWGNGLYYPQDLNNLGHAILYSPYYDHYTLKTSYLGYLWKNQTLTRINLGRATHINNVDQIVGATTVFDATSGVYTDLSTLIDQPGLVLGEALAINDIGQIVATGVVGGIQHTYLLNYIPADNTDLSVSITASPKAIVVGQSVTYTVTVKNRGMATATGVTVAGLTGCILSSDTIAMGSSATCSVTSTAAAALGTFTQAVSVSGNETDPNSTNNSATISTNVTEPADLAVTMSYASQVYGSSVTYNVTVTNNGPNTATGVTPSVVSNFLHSSGCDYLTPTGSIFFYRTITLVSGASATCSLTVTGPGVATTTFSVSGNEGDPNTANNSATITTSLVPATDLSVVISASPSPVPLGGLVTYRVTVHAALGNATGITLSGLPGCVLSGTTITLVYGYETVSCTVSIAATQLGTLIQTVSVSGNEFDPDTTNNTASISTISYSLDISPVNTVLVAGQTQALVATQMLGDGTQLSLSTPVAAVAPGGSHTCAILSDGTVRCLGYNGYGQLGNGTNATSSTPVTVNGISTATALAVEDTHNCALLSSGAVQCWGYNAYGQLGNGTITPFIYGVPTGIYTPVTVSGINTATALAVEGNHSCAVLSSGAVQCWGYNGYGELGNGTSTGSSVPVTVSGISTARAVAAGWNHSCAVLSSGAVQCWGFNTYGELGNGTNNWSTVPVMVNGISTATAVAAESDHSCALLSSGEVQCWGYNGHGELGNGTTTNSLVPVKVNGISTATAVAVGGRHACALLSGGAVQCWGSNGNGQLGNGTTTDSLIPVSVSGISTATAVVAENADSCAQLASGAVQCWGANDSGQLGNVISQTISSPVGLFGKWSSSDTTVATVSDSGLVSALSSGAAVISFSFEGISANTTITVNAPTYSLSITTQGSGTGITSGAGVYTAGQTATVTASANVGSTFAGWSGPNGATCASGKVLMDANKSCTATFTLNPAANLNLTLTDSTDPVKKGAKLVYTLTVKNNGPSSATNVTLTDTLPANIIFVSITKTQGTCTGTATVTCAIGTLKSGASATVTIAIKPQTVGTISDSATVSSAVADPNTANNSATTTTVVTK